MADQWEPSKPQPAQNAGEAAPRGIFISYASQDAGVAQKVCSTLEAAGHRCWMAPRDVKPGAHYADAIVRALNEARMLVLLLSADAMASSHVSRELERAASKRKLIIAWKLDAEVLSPAFEYFLGESQWIDVPNLGIHAALAKLVDGVGRSETGPTHQETRAVGNSNRNRLVVALVLTAMCLVAAAGVYWWSSSRHQAGSHTSVAQIEKSIAVLPFVDMSEKKDQEYFGDGMAEEIIDLLAKVPDLRVPARTSSFYFRGKNTKIADIAHELGVTNVLEGSIRRSGDRLRVTVQLVRADTGFHLWSDTYDRPFGDIFKLQDDIANSVVQALQITLMGGPLARRRGGTQDFDAYHLYLRAQHSMFQGTRASLLSARDDFDAAIKLDPEFGLAWAELSRDTLFLTNYEVLPPKEGYERARQLALHALELSPDLAEAHGTLSNVNRNYDWNWAASMQQVQQALALDPTNPAALTRAGQLSYTLGRWADAQRQLRLALVRDPLFNVALWSLGTAQYGAGKFAEAEATYRRVLELAPGFFLARSYLAKTLLAQGKPEAALSIVQPDDAGENLIVLPIALQAAGHQHEADLALQELTIRSANSQAFYVAMTYAYRNEKDLAFQWLDRAYQQREQNFVEFVGEPLFKNIAKDERYKTFLKKMNLPE